MSTQNDSKSGARKYHHGDLRRQLIEAALAIAAEEQAWDFSLREVARRAGVSHNAPYNHFPDKQALLDAVAAAGLELLLERLRPSIGNEVGASPKERLTTCAMAYLSFALEHRALYRLMLSPAVAPSSMEACPVRYGEPLLEYFQHFFLFKGHAHGAGAQDTVAQSDQSVFVSALSLWALLHGLAMLLIEGSITFSGTTHQLVDDMLSTNFMSFRTER